MATVAHIKKTRLALLLLTFAAFGCISNGNNPLNCNRNTDFPVVIQGLQLASSQGQFSMNDVAPGEAFTLPVQVTTMIGESEGHSVTVTPTVPAGFNVNPASAEVVLPSNGAAAFTTFTVTAPDQVETGTGTLSVGAQRETFATISDLALVRQDRTLRFVPNLVSANLTPVQATLPQSQTVAFSLGITPRGNTSGATALRARIVPPQTGVSVSPADFSLDLAQGSTTPVTQALTVSATANAVTGPTHLEIQTADGYVLDRSQLTVTASSGGGPYFTFTANKYEVATVPTVFSEDVTFTVNSINGFDANVKITWSTEDEATVNPSDNEFVVRPRPGFPARFVRRFYRYATHSEPVYIRFSAQDQPFTRTEEFSIKILYGN